MARDHEWGLHGMPNKSNIHHSLAFIDDMFVKNQLLHLTTDTILAHDFSTKKIQKNLIILKTL